jgi:hypothetical protein
VEPSKVHKAVYVDTKGDVFLEITYEDQTIFIPIELAKTLATELLDWVKTILDE